MHTMTVWSTVFSSKLSLTQELHAMRHKLKRNVFIFKFMWIISCSNKKGICVIGPQSIFCDYSAKIKFDIQVLFLLHCNVEL